MSYKMLRNNCLLQDERLNIPMDIGNSDYRKYLDWITEGNTPEPADPEPLVASIATDSNIIIGDGLDDIVLSVHGRGGELVVINTLCGATPGTINVQLDAEGNGSQTFSCETSPTVIVFSYGDISTKVRAL